MYNSHWAMEYNPFVRNNKSDNTFKTLDYINAIARLEHLKKAGGIGLFTGLAGTGKTFALREFSKTLNTSLYKTIYIPLSTVTVLEFYKSIAYGLDLDPPNKKVDIFKAIQDRVVTLSKDKRITTVAIIDEAQYLQTGILNDIKLLLNFDMDSRDYIVFVLAGQPLLNNILSKQVHESLKQRIVINYNFQGITKEEAKDYIKTKFALCGVHTEIINANALEAICSCSNGSIRKLNQIVDKCLLIGHLNKSNVIDTEVVLSAQNEIELV